MGAVFYLPLNKVIKAKPIYFPLFKWGNHGSEGSTKHSNLLNLNNYSPTNVTFSAQTCKKSGLLIVLFCFFMVILWPVMGTATEKNGYIISADDRALTIKALNAVKKNKWKEAERLVAETRNPLAAKLYYWLSYTRNSSNPSFRRVSRFILQNPDWPKIRTMRKTAEKHINPDTSAEDLLTFFDVYSPLTQPGMMRYLDTLTKRGQFKEVKMNARDWWTSSTLATSQQKEFYKHYRSYLDEASHQARFDFLINRKHYTNARTVARILGRGFPALAEARIAVAQNKGGVDQKVSAVPNHLKNDPGLLLERLRWRRRHDKNFGAMEILHNPPPAETNSNLEGWWKERHIIVRRLMEEGDFLSAYLLASKHQQEEGLPFAQAEFLSGFLALKYTKEPWRAFEHFEALYHRVKTPISKARGAYWAGRASEDLGHPEIARKWFRVSARYQTTYYGQLALNTLDDEYKPPQQMPPERILSKLNDFNRQEMVQVAKLLNRAGFKKETDSFLDALSTKLSEPEDYILVADLAEEFKHYHKAIKIAKKGLQKNIFMMEHAYPTLLSRMKNVKLEWALVHAIIRQESAFDFDAKSPAGASGLMQLMPATAKEVAKKKNLKHKHSWLVTRPDHNIALGSAYMKQMIERFDGAYALAAAAYNAGPGRVNRWLKKFGDPRTGDIDIIDWAELIPVYETRNYVQRVLEGTYVYRIKFRDLQKDQYQAPLHFSKTLNKN